MKRTIVLLSMFTLFFGAVSVNAAVDEDSAKSLIKKNKCGNCHALDKKKDGPSFKSIAKEFSDKPDAQTKLYKHLTTSPIVEVDGKKEKHKQIKAKNDTEINNLIQWILSR